MWILETAAVALGLYSALPVPQFEWTRRNMRYALAAFPLVGVLLALACWAWSALCAFLSLPALLRGAVLCVLPALVSGGIHLDGYCDTADALASHASPERMREILHDPHCGAFAVTRLCVYYITFFALCCVWVPTRPGLVCLGLGFVLSRALSGAALTLLPIAPGSGLARSFADAADKNRVRGILAVTAALCLLGTALAGGWRTLAAVCAVTLPAALHFRQTAIKRFGGVSGDLAGWFLVKLEFWLLAALTAVQILEGRG